MHKTAYQIVLPVLPHTDRRIFYLVGADVPRQELAQRHLVCVKVSPCSPSLLAFQFLGIDNSWQTEKKSRRPQRSQCSRRRDRSARRRNSRRQPKPPTLRPSKRYRNKKIPRQSRSRKRQSRARNQMLRPS